MKKMVMIATLTSLVGVAKAEPGFLRAVFTGSAYDGTSVVSVENGATIVTDPFELYTNSCPQRTTYAFVTYMLMEPGVTYHFKGAFDDFATLKIDDEWVLSRGSECEEVVGSYQVSGGLRWHKLDLRVANNGSGGGVTSSKYCGIVFKKGDAGSWTQFTLAGGVDFRTKDGGRLVSLQNYILNGNTLEGSLSFSQSNVDDELLLSSSQDGTNWTDTVVCSLGVNDDHYDFAVAVESDRPYVRFGIRQDDVENWSTTLDLAKAKDPILGGVSHNIVLGEDDVTFSIPVLALGAGAKKVKVYVRYGLAGTDDVKKTQVATVTSIGIVTPTLEDLIPDKQYSYTVIAENGNGGFVESKACSFVIGRKWKYSISNGEAWVTGVAPSTWDVVIPEVIDGYKVTKIFGQAFRYALCTSIRVPEGVTEITGDTFMECPNLRKMYLPKSLAYSDSLYNYYSPCDYVEFYGPHPRGNGNISVSSGYYSREFGASWLDVIDISTFKGYWQTNLQNVVIVSTAMRKNDPTVMEINYKVMSEKPTVKVRALAFEDGERSFAKVVRPTTFIEGTESAVGDSVAANVEHRLSWRVSADWKIDVAKVKFEVLAVEDDILPLELTTLPRIGEHPSIEYSWNVMEESRVLDALFWLYADGREGLTITDGVLKNGNKKLADGTKLNGYDTIAYVYSGMGYRVLAGEELEHVKNISRLKLSPSGFRQYAAKTLE